MAGFGGETRCSSGMLRGVDVQSGLLERPDHIDLEAVNLLLPLLNGPAGQFQSDFEPGALANQGSLSVDLRLDLSLSGLRAALGSVEKVRVRHLGRGFLIWMTFKHGVDRVEGVFLTGFSAD